MIRGLHLRLTRHNLKFYVILKQNFGFATVNYYSLHTDMIERTMTNSLLWEVKKEPQKHARGFWKLWNIHKLLLFSIWRKIKGVCPKKSINDYFLNSLPDSRVTRPERILLLLPKKWKHDKISWACHEEKVSAFFITIPGAVAQWNSNVPDLDNLLGLCCEGNICRNNKTWNAR